MLKDTRTSTWYQFVFNSFSLEDSRRIWKTDGTSAERSLFTVWASLLRLLRKVVCKVNLSFFFPPTVYI